MLLILLPILPPHVIQLLMPAVLKAQTFPRAEIFPVARFHSRIPPPLVRSWPLLAECTSCPPLFWISAPCGLPLGSTPSPESGLPKVQQRSLPVPLSPAASVWRSHLIPRIPCSSRGVQWPSLPHWAGPVNAEAVAPVRLQTDAHV